MTPIDPAKLKVAQRLQPVARAQVAVAQPARPVAEATSSAVTMPTRVNAGAEAPVEMDRVAVIRQAIEEGRYPLVPARIADAMIAAGYLLRIAK